MSEKKEDKKKKKQSVLEKEIFSIMEKSMKTALDAAVDDLLKDWNKESKLNYKRNGKLTQGKPLVGLPFFSFSAVCAVWREKGLSANRPESRLRKSNPLLVGAQATPFSVWWEIVWLS